MNSYIIHCHYSIDMCITTWDTCRLNSGNGRKLEIVSTKRNTNNEMRKGAQLMCKTWHIEQIWSKRKKEKKKKKKGQMMNLSIHQTPWRGRKFWLSFGPSNKYYFSIVNQPKKHLNSARNTGFQNETERIIDRGNRHIDKSVEVRLVRKDTQEI